MNVEIHEDANAVARTAAAIFCDVAGRAGGGSGRVAVVPAGGEAPRRFHLPPRFSARLRWLFGRAAGARLAVANPGAD